MSLQLEVDQAVSRASCCPIFASSSVLGQLLYLLYLYSSYSNAIDFATPNFKIDDVLCVTLWRIQLDVTKRVALNLSRLSVELGT